MTCGTGWPSWPSGRPGRRGGRAPAPPCAGPGPGAGGWPGAGWRSPCCWWPASDVLTSRLLADRERPPQTTTPPPDATPRQAAPLWTAKGGRHRPVFEPWDRGPEAAGDLVVAATGYDEPARVRGL